MSVALSAAEQRHPLHKVRREVGYNIDSYLSVHGGIDGMSHQTMDTHIRRDLGKNIVNRGRDPSLFFPTVSLPQVLCGRNQTPKDALEDIFKGLIVAKLYLPEASKWNLQDPSPGRPVEQIIPKFFNSVIAAVYSKVTQSRPGAVWRQHSNNLIEGIRKPDVILIRPGAQAPYRFGDLYSYCEIKATFNKRNASDALLLLSEIAGYATAGQTNRRFYVASSLCGKMLTLALFARGTTVISEPLDIDSEPRKFLTILIGLTSADPTWNGFDPSMVSIGFPQHNFRIHNFGSLPLVDVTDLLIFSSQAMHSRGTKVPLCEVTMDPAQATRSCALKMSWLPGNSLGDPTDIEISHLLATRNSQPLAGREADLFGESDAYSIFADCIKPPTSPDQPHWDYKGWLPGIPIVLESHRPQADNPLPTEALNAQGYYPPVREPRICDDTTRNIMARFDVPMRDRDGNILSLGDVSLSFEPRQSIRVLYHNCGTSLVWFSCRRELLNGIMGALVGHFNGLRKDVLHSDISDGNVMFEVEGPTAIHVVPEWPKDKNGPGYPKRAGMLGDWGYGADLRSTNERSGRVTGTFPFIASELLSKAGRKGKVYHEVHHDLEALFWVLWIVCVNLNGPFYQRRLWRDDKEDITKEEQLKSHQSGSSCIPVVGFATPTIPALPTLNPPPPLPLPDADAISLKSRSTESTTNSDSYLTASTLVEVVQRDTRPLVDHTIRVPCDGGCSVPIWATPGVHLAGPEAVYAEKTYFPQARFIDSLSPYFRDSGDEFLQGLRELHQYFVGGEKQDLPRITHLTFLDILKKMFDGIKAENDRPSDIEIAQGRERYQALLDRGGTQGIAISVLDGPKTRGAASKSVYAVEKSASKRHREAADPSGGKRSRR